VSARELIGPIPISHRRQDPSERSLRPQVPCAQVRASANPGTSKTFEEMEMDRHDQFAAITGMVRWYGGRRCLPVRVIGGACALGGNHRGAQRSVAACRSFRTRAIVRLLQTAQHLPADADRTIPEWSECPPTSNNRSASCAIFLTQAGSRSRNHADAAPFAVADLEDLVDQLSWTARLPSRFTARLYWFSTSACPASSWRTVSETPSSMSIGSKPVMTIGTRYSPRSVHIPSYPMTVQTCPGPRKSLHAVARRFKNRRHRGRHKHVRHQHAEIRQLPLVCQPHRHRIGGAVVSKPMAKKTTLRSGLAAASVHRVERRIDRCARRRPCS
jgi:hypothetical protein